MNGHFLDTIQEPLEKAVGIASEVKKPKRFKVILLNDDYTPMEFVVDVLLRFFHMDEKAAVFIMLQVHMQGKGICGVFTHEIAETKVAQVNAYARINEHPLLCSMEPE